MMHPSLSIKQSPAYGRAVYITEEIPMSTTLFAIPQSLVISRENVLAHDPVLGPLLQRDELQRYALQLKLLCEKHKGDRSDWHVYISNLPTAFTMLMYFDQEEKRELQDDGRMSLDGVLEQLALIAEYEGIRQDVLAPNPGLEQRLFGSEGFSFEEYKWAHSIVRTRALPGRHGRPVLVPLVDMVNHRFGSYSIDKGTQAPDGSWIVTASHDLRKGSELTFEYCWADNHFFLSNFGFIDDDNPHDGVAVSVDNVGMVTITAASAAPPPSPALTKAVEERLRSYPTTLAEDAVLLAQEKRRHRQLAVRYRMSKKKILLLALANNNNNKVEEEEEEKKKKRITTSKI